MKKQKNTNFLEWNRNILLSSIKKINTSFILIIALDALFYALAGLLAYFWLQRVQLKILSFNVPQNLASLGYEQVQAVAKSAQMLYVFLIASFILLVVAIIFLASISKGIIWARTIGAKPTLKLISKFLGLNLIWMTFWIGLAISASILLNPESVPAFLAAMLFIALYFTNTLYTLFIKTGRFSSLKDAIKFNIIKARMLALPYALVFAIFYLLGFAANLASFRYSSILFSLILITYTAWVRHYASSLVLELEKPKHL
ncbi:hypothetical protein HYS31_04845 [Candidatus Woesearchaeota archaeon]|nr:hypothetical protein [Candidatus Woesearchaeota archaeon]